MDLAALIPSVVRIAQIAGERIMTIYNSPEFNIENKNDNSPLTAADLASHHYIVDHLKQLTPKIPILSEESAKLPYSERAQWTTYWLVDPLDGTREFIKKNGEFSVLIALIHNQQAVLGAVHTTHHTQWQISTKKHL